MKDFMMIFIGADYQELGLSPEQLQDRMGKWFAWGEKMGAQGILKGGEALVPNIKRIIGNDSAQDYPDYDLGGTVEIREVMVFDR